MFNLRNRVVPYPLVIILLAALYFVMGQIGLHFAIIYQNVSLVWGASAIAYAALLIGGVPLWPGIAIGACLVNLTAGVPLAAVLMITAGNTGGPVLATVVLRKYVRHPLTFDHIREIVVFALFGTVVASVVISINGTLALMITDSAARASGATIWLEWFLGDSIGMLVLTPFLLLWWNNPRLGRTRREWLEALALGTSVVVLCLLIFQPNGSRVGNFPLTYLVMPFTLWAALRFGARGASTICLIIAIAALIAVARQMQIMALTEVHQDLIYLWSFLTLTTVCSLVLAAVVADRTRVENELARQRDYVAQVVNAMHHGVAVTDMEGRFEYVNPAYAEMVGFSPAELLGKKTRHVLPQDERAIITASALHLTSDTHLMYETRLQRASGEPIDVLVNGALRRDENRVTGIITSITDLTAQKKAAAELRRNEALLKTIMNNLPFDLWVNDSDGRCIFQTPQSIQLWGNSLGKTIEEVTTSPETLQTWRANNTRVASGETVSGDATYTVQGEQRHYFSIITPVHAGHVTFGIMGINVDITERVRAQDELLKNQEIARQFLDDLKALQDINIALARIDDFDTFCRSAIELGCARLRFERLGLWLVDLNDPDFTVGTYGTAEDGSIRDERQSRLQTSQVLPQATNMVEIADKKIYFNSETELWDEYAQPVGSGWVAMGYMFDEDRVIGGLSADNYFSHKPAHPNQLELLALFSNMLGHLCVLKRAQAQLNTSEAQFRSVFSGINVGIALVNAAGRIVSANPAFRRLLRYDDLESVVLTVDDITHPDDIPQTTAYFNELLGGSRDSYQMEKRHRRSDGEYVWVRLNVSLFPGEGDVRAIGLIEDISARKAAEAEIQRINASLEQRVAERTRELQAANERLTELDRLKTKFIADVTHELRTPLTVLSTRVYLLQHSPPEKHPLYLAALKEQLERLTNFVNATLDLSRLELGRDRIAFGSVDLNDVIQQVYRALEPRAEIAGLQMTFRPSEVPGVSGEFNQLAQVVTNLVANAINYTPNGSVTLSTSLAEDRKHVCLEVADTGIGITDSEIPHLFTRFYRGETAGQSNIPGTGLGLSIVKEIVDLHAGTIAVQSQIGQGTVFRVYLPIFDVISS